MIHACTVLVQPAQQSQPTLDPQIPSAGLPRSSQNIQTCFRSVAVLLLCSIAQRHVKSVVHSVLDQAFSSGGEHRALTLVEALNTSEARTSAVGGTLRVCYHTCAPLSQIKLKLLTTWASGVLQALREQGVISGWRDELYPVALSFDATPAFLIERAAAVHFGIKVEYLLPRYYQLHSLSESTWTCIWHYSCSAGAKLCHP